MGEREGTPDGTSGLGVQRRPVWLPALAVFAVTVVAGLYMTAGSRDSSGAASSGQSDQVLDSAGAPSEQGETVDIPTLGLSVIRPARWVTITADQNVRNIRTVQMDDPEFQELAARYATTPVFAISKYPEPYPDLNPSFKINVRPLGGLARLAPEDILTAALPTVSRAFKDVQVLEGPRSARVSGRKAAYARISYTLRARDLAVPTISEIWVVPKGSIFFMIGGGTRADEKNGSRAEIRRILDGVRIN